MLVQENMRVQLVHGMLSRCSLGSFCSWGWGCRALDPKSKNGYPRSCRSSGACLQATCTPNRLPPPFPTVPLRLPCLEDSHPTQPMHGCPVIRGTDSWCWACRAAEMLSASPEMHGLGGGQSPPA